MTDLELEVKAMRENEKKEGIFCASQKKRQLRR
jgi:hypothetical protein